MKDGDYARKTWNGYGITERIKISGSLGWNAKRNVGKKTTSV